MAFDGPLKAGSNHSKDDVDTGNDNLLQQFANWVVRGQWRRQCVHSCESQHMKSRRCVCVQVLKNDAVLVLYDQVGSPITIL